MLSANFLVAIPVFTIYRVVPPPVHPSAPAPESYEAAARCTITAPSCASITRRSRPALRRGWRSFP